MQYLQSSPIIHVVAMANTPLNVFTQIPSKVYTEGAQIPRQKHDAQRRLLKRNTNKIHPRLKWLRGLAIAKRVRAHDEDNLEVWLTIS